MEQNSHLSNRQWKAASVQRQVQPAQAFTLVSYNILSEQLLKKSSYFNKISPEYWHRTGRHARLLTELDSLGADLLCLQEVDKDYWTQCLEADLQRRGYAIRQCSWRDEEPIEGVVTCARESVFELADRSTCTKSATVHGRCGRLSDLVLSQIRDAGQAVDQKTLAEYASAPQRYGILQLKHRASNQLLTVGNAHISYQRPPKPDLRAAQAVAMVAQTASVADESAYLVCGDFNSTPDSLAYQCVLGSCPAAFEPEKAHQELPLMGPLSAFLNQRKFQSSCVASAYQTALGKEPDCTLNLTNNTGCVDFIFYDLVHLTPIEVLEVPSWYIQRDKDCVPDCQLASDHLSIAARLQFI